MAPMNAVAEEYVIRVTGAALVRVTRAAALVTLGLGLAVFLIDGASRPADPYTVPAGAVSPGAVSPGAVSPITGRLPAVVSP